MKGKWKFTHMIWTNIILNLLFQRVLKRNVNVHFLVKTGETE